MDEQPIRHVLSDRLRFEPITAHHAPDYRLVFQDDAIAEWYAGKPTDAEVLHAVQAAERRWRMHGFDKWLIYEHGSTTVVGRGGLSALQCDAYNGALRSFLPQDSWVHEKVACTTGTTRARHWAEIGWALRRPYWGRGYATEIGRFGIRWAFAELDLQAIVAFTERHNHQSRRVMERVGMTFAGEFLGTGLIDGTAGVHADAPFAVYLAMRESWTPR